MDYLVEDNTRDDFAYHRKWMEPMVGPLLKIIQNSSCCEGNPWKIGTMVVQAGNKRQMLGMILVTGVNPNSRE